MMQQNGQRRDREKKLSKHVPLSAQDYICTKCFSTDFWKEMWRNNWLHPHASLTFEGIYFFSGDYRALTLITHALSWTSCSCVAQPWPALSQIWHTICVPTCSRGRARADRGIIWTCGPFLPRAWCFPSLLPPPLSCSGPSLLCANLHPFPVIPTQVSSALSVPFSLVL